MRYVFAILLVLLVFSCKKNPSCFDGIKNQDEVNIDCGGTCSACPVEYNSQGFYGLNLLSGSDTIFTTDEYFSLKASIPSGSTLKLLLKRISGDVWYYDALTKDNWLISTYSDTEENQLFEALNSGNCDVKIYLPNPVSFSITYFENSTSETKRKIVVKN